MFMYIQLHSRNDQNKLYNLFIKKGNWRAVKAKHSQHTLPITNKLSNRIEWVSIYLPPSGEIYFLVCRHVLGLIVTITKETLPWWRIWRCHAIQITWEAPEISVLLYEVIYLHTVQYVGDRSYHGSVKMWLFYSFLKIIIKAVAGFRLLKRGGGRGC